MCGGVAVKVRQTAPIYHLSRAGLGGAIRSSVNSFPDKGCGTPYRYVKYRNAKTLLAMSRPCRFYLSWKRAKCDVLNGDKTAVFHTCRHMAAILFANDAMVNTKLIGHFLGHANERTTNRYIHAKKSSLIETLNMV